MVIGRNYTRQLQAVYKDESRVPKEKKRRNEDLRENLFSFHEWSDCDWPTLLVDAFFFGLFLEPRYKYRWQIIPKRRAEICSPRDELLKGNTNIRE